MRGATRRDRRQLAAEQAAFNAGTLSIAHRLSESKHLLAVPITHPRAPQGTCSRRLSRRRGGRLRGPILCALSSSHHAALRGARCCAAAGAAARAGGGSNDEQGCPFAAPPGGNARSDPAGQVLDGRGRVGGQRLHFGAHCVCEQGPAQELCLPLRHNPGELAEPDGEPAGFRSSGKQGKLLPARAGSGTPSSTPPEAATQRCALQTALHFLVCSVSIWFAQKGGMIKQTTMPFNGARRRRPRC